MTKEPRKLELLCIKLCKELEHAHSKAWPNLNTPNFTFSKGRKYWKIVHNENNENSYPKRSVWGFINFGNDKFDFGDVIKANGWSTPTLNKARGNLFSGYHIPANSMRIYGPDYLI